MTPPEIPGRSRRRRGRRARSIIGKVAFKLGTKKSKVQLWAVALFALAATALILVHVLTRPTAPPPDEVWITG